MKNPLVRFLLLGLIVFVIFRYLANPPNEVSTAKVDTSTFISEINNGRVEGIRTYPDQPNTRQYIAVYNDKGKRRPHYEEFPNGVETILIIGGPAAEFIEKLAFEGKVIFLVHESASGSWLSFSNILILVLIGLIGIGVLYNMRQQQMGGAGGKMNDFTKSRARSATEHKVTFADVAGCGEAKEELVETVEAMKNPLLLKALGGKIPKGILFHGPSGTGKTLLARALAGEAGVPFFSVSGSDFVEMLVGVGASRVRSMMQTAKKNAPCILFIDELDAVGRHRGSGIGGGHDEREQTLNQLLVEMDGFEQDSKVIFVAATNRPDILDPALLRPGRFDKKINVPLPDFKARGAILKIHTCNKPLAEDVCLEDVAKMTPGFSGADLGNLANEAAKITLKKIKQDTSFYENLKERLADIIALKKVNEEAGLAISHDSFVRAWETIAAGGDERRIVMNQSEKERIAYHEAGHAVVAYIKYVLEPNDSDPLYKVSIIPRGQALGITYKLPQEESFLFTKRKAYNDLLMLYGGWAAERMKFGDNTSSGVENDIERATEMVKKMVLKWGMSKNLPPIYLGESENVYLGMELTRSRKYSGATEKEINEEIRELISIAHKKAELMIRKNLPAMEALVKALLEKETLNAEECEEILSKNIPSENLRTKVYSTSAETFL